MATTHPYDLPNELRPREKLIRDPKATSLSDAELVAIVLNTGTVGCPVMELANRVLAAFPSMDEFVNADWKAMEGRIDEYNEKNPALPIRGVAQAKLLRIAASFELVRRSESRISAEDFRNTDLSKASGAAKLFSKILKASPEKEHFYVLPIDNRLHALCEPLDVSQGSVTKTPVHPRDVFCEAVRYRAYAIIVAHNHPSGDPTPSQDDIDVTKRLIETGQLHGIRVLDHLVLGGPESNEGKGYVSIRSLGTLKF